MLFKGVDFSRTDIKAAEAKWISNRWPRVCKAYSAKTNGKVERPFRCIRKDFFLNRTFRNLDDFNAQFDKWHGEIANPCVHAAADRIVGGVLAEEHSALIALPEQQRERGQATTQPT